MDAFGVATKENGVVALVCAFTGALVANWFGGWSASLGVLLWLIAGDYFTGLIASVIDGTGLSSRVGFIGIAKKVLIFFLVLISHKLDIALRINFTMEIVVYFYITNELISLIENLGRIGVPVPAQLVNVIQALKGKSK